MIEMSRLGFQRIMCGERSARSPGRETAGIGGKTSNVEYIYGKVAPSTRGRLIRMATEAERTLFFDFLAVDLGVIHGFRTRLHLYTVPGQVYYRSSRKLILRGADGIVFVADSQVERLDANLESMDSLFADVVEQAHPGADPRVVQYNKRDLPNILSVGS
jgi:mutual gliding-motility protein MglA